MATKVDQVQIDYTVQFMTPFHCGTGMRSGLADRTVTKDQEGYLYIPGSTFKGVLRERCEQLARFYGQDDEARKSIVDPHNARSVLRELGRKPSMVTRIFGSQYHPGQLFFDDIHQSKEAIELYSYDANEKDGRYKNIQVGLYTQVRLDRQTRTSVKGALYTSEFGVRGLQFNGSINGWLECIAVDEIEDSEALENPKQQPTHSLLLLLAGLLLVDRLGGNKSTGKGQCQCRIDQVWLNGKECAQERWEAWLDHLDALSLYSLWLEEA